MVVTEFDVLMMGKVVDEEIKAVFPGYTKPIIDRVEINPRAKGYYAKIGKIAGKPGHFFIRVGGLFALIPDQAVAKRKFKETIMHEHLHTVPGCWNHGEQWKCYASILNRTYGYDIKRTTDGETLGITKDKPQPKYVIKCPHCGKEYYYVRKPQYHVAMYRCGRCKQNKLILLPYTCQSV
jgi:predicted SprT family Zn-dependent metalloprotease